MSGFNLTTLKGLTTKIVSMNSFLHWVHHETTVIESSWTEDDLTDIAIQFNQLLDQLRQSLPSPDKLAIDMDDGWQKELTKFFQSQNVLLETFQSCGTLELYIDPKIMKSRFNENMQELDLKSKTIKKALVELVIKKKIEEMMTIIIKREENRSDQEAAVSDVKKSLVQVANKLDELHVA